MKLGLIFSAVLATNVLWGCSQSVPDCDSSKVTDLVIQIANQELESSPRLLWKSTFTSVNTIRTTNINEKTQARECAAQIDESSVFKQTGKERMSSKPITYTVEKIEDKDEIYVSVYGL